MRKSSVFFLCLFIGLLCGSGQSISGETQKEICVPLKTMRLKAPKTVEATRPPVEFSHSKHLLLYSCKTCHHDWDGGEQVSSCTASGCHGPTKPPKVIKRTGRASWLDFSVEQIKYFKNAFHRQCIVCHKEIKLRNIALLEKSKGGPKPELEPTGPNTCRRCHIEK